MESIADRCVRILGRRPEASLPLPELLDALRREVPGFALDEPRLSGEIRRAPDRLHLVPEPARILPPLDGWSADDLGRYGGALTTAGLAGTPHVVPRLSGEPGLPGPPRRPLLVERMRETLRAVAAAVDEGAPRTAARWHRLAREARRVREVVSTPPVSPPRPPGG